ncbi:hypothetical protein [Streptacidiphilus sp. PAMC 29251]
MPSSATTEQAAAVKPPAPADRATARAERIAASDAAFRDLIAEHRFSPRHRRCSQGCPYWPCDPLWRAAAVCDAALAQR